MDSINLDDEQLRELINSLTPLDNNIKQNECISSIYSKTNIADIQNKIANFKQVDLKNISDKDLYEAISEVLNIKINGKEQQLIVPQFYTYPASTRFYRVRILPTDSKALDEFFKISAYWNPPENVILKPGRLNKPHESLLYTSLNPFTAISEMRIKANQFFALIVYQARQSIKMNIIGADRDIPEFSEDVNTKMKLYNNFFTGGIFENSSSRL